MKSALTSGINLVETSSMYGAGHAGQAERMIGQAIREVDVPREEVVVVTKIGSIEREALKAYNKYH